MKKLNKQTFEKKVKEVKNRANKANEFALKTTEEVVTEGIEFASQWQGITEKAIKGSITLLGKQQDIVFTALEEYKTNWIKGKERLRKVFA